MEQFLEVFKFLGLDAGLLALAVTLALLLRVARGMIHWVGEKWTFFVGLGLGVLGAILKMAEHESWRVTVTNAVVLTVVVLVGQKILQASAEKVGWLPRDNEWLITKPKE